MKNLLSILLVSFILIGCSENKSQDPDPKPGDPLYHSSDNVINPNDSLYFLKNDMSLVTGMITFSEYTIHVKNGKRHGKYEEKTSGWTYSSFKFPKLLYFKNNKLDGEYKQWYTSQWDTFVHTKENLKVSGNYKDGEISGIWRSYYQDGKLKFEGNYSKGKLISQTCWDISGNKIDCDLTWLVNNVDERFNNYFKLVDDNTTQLTNTVSTKVNETKISKELNKISTNINSQLPLKLDQYTTWINTVVVDETLRYNYKIDTRSFKELNMSKLEWEKVKVNEMTTYYCTQNDHKYFKKNNITCILIYTNLSGKIISSFDINSNDCK